MQVAGAAEMHEVQDKKNSAQGSDGTWLGQPPNYGNLKPKGFLYPSSSSKEQCTRLGYTTI